VSVNIFVCYFTSNLFLQPTYRAETCSCIPTVLLGEIELCSTVCVIHRNSLLLNQHATFTPNILFNRTYSTKFLHVSQTDRQTDTIPNSCSYFVEFLQTTSLAIAITVRMQFTWLYDRNNHRRGYLQSIGVDGRIILKCSSARTSIGSGLDSFRSEKRLAVGYFEYCKETLGLVYRRRGRREC